jgi:methylated-DNA-[protein]-cysteine S-methyltransferase
MEDMASTVIDSPIGPLGLVSTRDGLTGVRFHAHGFPSEGKSTVLVDAAEQLELYFSGELTAFDLPVDLEGSEFQRRCWLALATIPYGQTVSYGEQARRLGYGPEKARAVGAANGQNPLPLVLPCHRVIGADGSLTGFGGGLPMKRFLLEHEGALLPLNVG